MEFYVTSIEDIEMAAVNKFAREEALDGFEIEVDLISPETREQIVYDLLSELRSDSRLIELEDEDGVFYCSKKNLNKVERKYGLTFVDAEQVGYVL